MLVCVSVGGMEFVRSNLPFIADLTFTVLQIFFELTGGKGRENLCLGFGSYQEETYKNSSKQ